MGHHYPDFGGPRIFATGVGIPTQLQYYRGLNNDLYYLAGFLIMITGLIKDPQTPILIIKASIIVYDQRTIGRGSVHGVVRVVHLSKQYGSIMALDSE